MNKEQIMEAIEKMTVLELSELVKALEEKFGVSASAPMAVAAAPAAAAAAPVAEEQTEFDVTRQSRAGAPAGQSGERARRRNLGPRQHHTRSRVRHAGAAALHERRSTLQGGFGFGVMHGALLE